MRTWRLAVAHRTRLLTGLSLVLLVALSIPALLPAGSFDDFAAGSSRSECGYLKIFRWRDTDPHMVVPGPSADRFNVAPESSPSPLLARAAREPVPDSTPAPSSRGDAYSPDCHPLPRLTPLDPVPR